jgi:nuclear pore complex protein Nup205
MIVYFAEFNFKFSKAKFLKFMMDCRSLLLLKAGLTVIGAISSGSTCAQHAFEFLSSDQCRMTWDALFRSLDMAAKSKCTKKRFSVKKKLLIIFYKALAAYPDREIHPDDQTLQQTFLKLLTEIVRFSDSARVTLFSNQSLQAVTTLFALLTRRIPVEMKAALFESISAFCVPAQNGGSAVLANAVWLQLESADVIPGTKRNSGLPNFSSFEGIHSQKSATRIEGIRYDLDQIESQNQTYPETIAFLALLNVISYLSSHNG